jgi:hydrogenase maturation protease
MDANLTLIIGYGNPDRQDDGVAWHILARLAGMLGRPIPHYPDEGFDFEGCLPELLFTLQITPELAEQISRFTRVCFIDAHTGKIPDDLHIEEIVPSFQRSPLTHHMTPETCLALTQTLYGSSPKSISISVRGFEFGFSHELTQSTNALADRAAAWVYRWLNSTENNLLSLD